MAKMDFNNTNSMKMVSKVMAKVEESETDEKKRNIDVSLIDSNPDNENIFGYDDNEMEALVETIKNDGFNGAINVFAKSDGRYEIYSGHRRYLAALKNGYKTIPCNIKEEPDEATKAKLLINSNIFNRKLSPLRIARSIDYYDKNVLSVDKTLYEGRKRDALAHHFRVTHSTIHRYTALLKLIPELQKLVDEPNFPYNIFMSITTLDEDMQREVYYGLQKMAENEDISTLSKTLIDQYVNKCIRIKSEKEQEEQYQEEINTNNMFSIDNEEIKEKKEVSQSSQLMSFEEAEQESFATGFGNAFAELTNDEEDEESESNENAVNARTQNVEENNSTEEINYHVRKIKHLVASSYIFRTNLDIRNNLIEKLNEIIESLK